LHFSQTTTVKSYEIIYLISIVGLAKTLVSKGERGGRARDGHDAP